MWSRFRSSGTTLTDGTSRLTLVRPKEVCSTYPVRLPELDLVAQESQHPNFPFSSSMVSSSIRLPRLELDEKPIDHPL